MEIITIVAGMENDCSSRYETALAMANDGLQKNRTHNLLAGSINHASNKALNLISYQ